MKVNQKKSSERKSPITELKTNIKITNSNKQEFTKQDTSEGKVNVKIVTMDMKNLENLQDLLTQTEQENKQLKSDMNNRLNLKKIWLKNFNRQKEKIRG